MKLELNSGKLKVILFSLLIITISFFIIENLTPDYHPNGWLNTNLTKEKINEFSNELIDRINPELKNQIKKISLDGNVPLLNWLRNEYRLDEANRKIKDNKFSSFWTVKVLSDNDTNLVISANQNRNVESQTALEIKINQDARVNSFTQFFNETKINDYLEADSAKKFIEKFISDFTGYIKFIEDSNSIYKNSYFFFPDKIETIEKPNRKDYNFTWKGSTDSGDLIYLNATIIGNKIKKFNLDFPVPEEFKSSEINIYEVITTPAFVIIIIIMVIIIGLRRIKSYEIGFKTAFVIAVIYSFFFALNSILNLDFEFKWPLLVGIALGGIFIFIAAVALWAVGETYFREIWNDKFLVIDLIRNKILLHNEIGKFLLVSVTGGILLTAVYLLIISVSSTYFHLNFLSTSFQSFNHITSKSPLVYLFSQSISSNFFIIIPLILFGSALIKRFFQDRISFIIINSILFSIFLYLFIEPLYISLTISFLISLMLSLLFIEFDILSVAFSYFLFNFYLRSIEFNFIGNDALSSNWIFTILLSSIIVLIGVILIIKKDKEIDLSALAPKYIENITERQRLKKELEVAKIVQMGFLPTKNPELKGIQIASVCVPAFEVGGDYYDFINLSENKIGIIIGDVSGKGTQAAFYMTLAKGFIKAIAKNSDSPAKILSQMNELFYENVERGRFISMIYAILDVNTGIMKLARAGHNPVILNKTSGKINLITPKGIALGLEKGELFNKVIEEETIDLEKGNTFVFFTDGFTEAVNKNNEEFGVERLNHILEKYSYLSAQEQLDKILSEVKNFIGKVHQHDDMTMVIVKIVE